jgi:hypothetical protein
VSGCCYIGVDGDLGDSGISNFEVALCGEPFDDIESNGRGELLGGEPESFGLPFGWFWEVFEFHTGNNVYRDSPDLLSLPILPSSFFPLLEFDLGALAKRSVSLAFAEVFIGDAHVVRSSIQPENRVYLCTLGFEVGQLMSLLPSSEVMMSCRAWEIFLSFPFFDFRLRFLPFPPSLPPVLDSLLLEEVNEASMCGLGGLRCCLRQDVC